MNIGDAVIYRGNDEEYRGRKGFVLGKIATNNNIYSYSISWNNYRIASHQANELYSVKETKAMNIKRKFKIGDRVQLLSDSYAALLKNEVYTVTSISSFNDGTQALGFVCKEFGNNAIANGTKPNWLCRYFKLVNRDSFIAMKPKNKPMVHDEIYKATKE